MTDTAAIRARHVKTETWDRGNSRADADGYIRYCSLDHRQDWPCDAAVVLAALDAALEQNDGLYEAVRLGGAWQTAAEAREQRLRAALDRVEALAVELDFGRVSRGEAAFIIRAALATEAE